MTAGLHSCRTDVSTDVQNVSPRHLFAKRMEYAAKIEADDAADAFEAQHRCDFTISRNRAAADFDSKGSSLVDRNRDFVRY
jgi:hypothetical protein